MNQEPSFFQEIAEISMVICMVFGVITGLCGLLFEKMVKENKGFTKFVLTMASLSLIFGAPWILYMFLN